MGKAPGYRARSRSDEHVLNSLDLEGRPQDMIFHKKFTYENSSFVDSSKTETTDMVTLTVSWKEGIGTDESSHPVDDREIVVKVPVWR